MSSGCRSPSSVTRDTSRPLLGALLCGALLLSPGAARATGGGDDDENGETFFAPEIIDRPDEAPFFLSEHAFYEGEGALPADVIEEVNRKEWSAYLRGKVADANLTYLLYAMKLGDLDKLIWTVEGKKSPTLLKEVAAVKADLDAVGDKDQVLRALYYLGFAKRCQPIATRMAGADEWDSDKVAAQRTRDAAAAGKLLSSSEGLVAATKDPFLQDRYRFQRLRLMFYAGRYADAQQYYAAHIGAFAADSSVKYRFLSTAAGAYYRDKQYGPANYLSSVVFDRFPPLKRSAYLSFKPVDDADWKQSLSLAKSDRERAVLWQLLGIAADGLAAIEKIYALSPTSDLLPLLLVREVNRAESDWAQNESRRADTRGTGAAEARPDAEVVGKKRLALLRRIADAKKAYRPYLWQVAAGHLAALAGDTQAALSYLDQAERSAPKASAAARQARISRLFARMRAIKNTDSAQRSGAPSIDKAQEPYLAAELKWLKGDVGLRGSALSVWTLGRLSDIYKAGGDPLRAVLLANRQPSGEHAPDDRLIDQILAFQAQPGKPAFDALLADNYGYTKSAMLELKALNQLYAGRFKGAVELLQQAGAMTGGTPLLADPFVIHIVDCHDCDINAKRAVSYTRGTFARRLLELSAQAQRKGKDGAQASFLLANGLYNMTYYGNGRDIYGSAFPEQDTDAPNYQMDLAERYYKRAMELSSDKEFKAQACFMAAKAEQNRYFNNATASSGSAGGAEPVHSPVYFKQLKDSFADTRYYQEIIRECGYFRKYLGKK